MHQGTRPLRPRERDQLLALGVTEAEYASLVNYFLGDRWDYIERRPETAEWRLIRKVPLSHATILRHLRGERWIGTGARWNPVVKRFTTAVMIVDLDFGGEWTELLAGRDPGNHWTDLLRRYDHVVRVLGAPSVLFKSSGSGGLHLYYFLTEPVDLHRLRSPDGDGAVMRLLHAGGLHERNGAFEVYPRGHYPKRGVHNRIRLPFGAESVRLDPFHFTRTTADGALNDLRAVHRELEAGVIRFTDPADWFAKACGLPPVPQAAQRGHLRRAMNGDSDPIRLDARAVRIHGIPGPKTFNLAVTALVRDLRRRGVPESAAAAEIHRWLDTGHNGRSRTFNVSPTAAHAEVDQILARMYTRTALRNWVPLPGLSEFEAGLILSGTGSDHALADRETGVVLSRYKVQLFCFELLNHAKQWVLTEAGGRAARFQDHVPGTERWNAAMLNAMSKEWPDPGRPEFVVPIPFNLRTGFKGFGGDLHGAYWRVVQAAGLCRVEGTASRWCHRAATFRICLDFGAGSRPNLSFHNLDRALGILLTPSEIRRIYSRHYAQKILRAVLSPVAPAGDVLVHSLFNEHLRPAFASGCWRVSPGIGPAFFPASSDEELAS